MKEGALVLADCLGFKGIWNRVDPEKLIDRLKAIEAEAMSRDQDRIVRRLALKAALAEEICEPVALLDEVAPLPAADERDS